MDALDYMNFDMMDNEVAECQRMFENDGVEGCKRFLEEKQDSWKNVPLNIAVIGNSGVGKSSFINAIRRLTADDEGAAAVGVTETTVAIQDYSHPNNPLLKFWDLPGVGTDNFPRETYLQDIRVDRYDFFLLISATRFTENDTWLGNEFSKRHKRYFYVRTKVGHDISDNKKSHPRTHDEATVLRQIRKTSEEHLKNQGSQNIRVFLIDSYKAGKFDFNNLEESLVRDFPDLKRSAMILSMCAFSKEMVNKKVKELRARMWKISVASAAVAAVPVPGLSIAFDTSAILAESNFYFKQLGLDEKSLQQRAAMMYVDFTELKAIVDKTVGTAFFTFQSLKAIAAMIPEAAASVVVEEVARYIPFIGSLIAAPISFGGTYYMLNYILNKMEAVSQEIIEYAAEHSKDTEQED